MPRCCRCLVHTERRLNKQLAAPLKTTPSGFSVVLLPHACIAMYVGGGGRKKQGIELKQAYEAAAIPMPAAVTTSAPQVSGDGGCARSSHAKAAEKSGSPALSVSASDTSTNTKPVLMHRKPCTMKKRCSGWHGQNKLHTRVCVALTRVYTAAILMIVWRVSLSMARHCPMPATQTAAAPH